MAIKVNENGTLNNTAADGNRIAIRLWPAASPPYSSSDQLDWVDNDRPYLSVSNPSVDYVWPFNPAFILYVSVYDTNSSFVHLLLHPDAEPITRATYTYGGWLCGSRPAGVAYDGGYWVYGKSGISLSGNIMTVTYFDIDRTKDKHSADDPRYVQGLFIAIA